MMMMTTLMMMTMVIMMMMIDNIAVSVFVVILLESEMGRFV